MIQTNRRRSDSRARQDKEGRRKLRCAWQTGLGNIPCCSAQFPLLASSSWQNLFLDLDKTDYYFK